MPNWILKACAKPANMATKITPKAPRSWSRERQTKVAGENFSEDQVNFPNTTWRQTQHGDKNRSKGTEILVWGEKNNCGEKNRFD